jgi:V/A-type H+-transporting ATPase subunit B
LTPLDKQYMEFGERFEREFIKQKQDENRTIEETLDIGWAVLKALPAEELHRVTDEEIEEFYY